MKNDKLNVLFLCTGNSARSIMAEALLSSIGANRFNAYSAGSHPKGFIHPAALKLLQAMNFEITHYRSKSWDDFSSESGPKLDFIFTVCDNAAGETCPLWPGKPVSAHWGIADPDRKYTSEEAEMDGFLTAFRQLEEKIRAFTELPLDEMNHSTLEESLLKIGQI